MDRLRNIHPGEILREEFLVPLDLSAYRLSRDIAVPQTRISQILAGRRGISADTAVRLGRYFNTSAEFWMNLQVAYDVEEVVRAKSEEMEAIPVYPACMAAAPAADRHAAP